MRLNRVWAAPVAVAAMILTVLATPAGAGPFTPVVDAAPRGERYVALGDSFASGPGVLPMRPGICERSTKNYSSVLAARLRVAAFTDASCGGARIRDFFSPQQRGSGTNPAQLRAVGPDTTLVTFGTIGGNDADLVGLALSCFGSDCSGDPVQQAADRVDALVPELRRGLQEVRRRAPQAVVVVVGYGTYLPSTSCLGAQITDAEVQALQGVIDRLSDTLRATAVEEGAVFADMREVPGAADHTACAAPQEQWIRALETFGDGAPLHPSTAGMQASAVYLEAVVREAWATTGGHPVVAGTPWREQASKALASTRFTRSCSGPRKRKKVKLVVRGGRSLVKKVEFRVGKKKVRTDGSAPFRTTLRAAKWRKVKGRVTAKVTVVAGPVRRTATLRADRPGCLRR